MATINPPPAEKPFVISPSQRVSALFPTTENLDAVVDAFSAAGFANEDIEVFLGPEGTEIVSPNARRHSAVVRFLKNLELLLSDETAIHKKTAETLKNGGMLVQVNTEGDEARKEQAAAIVRRLHPIEAQYWGQLAIEKLA
jgi:hypothetical protein